MKRKYNIAASFVICLLLISSYLFVACEKDDDKKSDQIELFSYGPMPVARGGELRFIGRNLDKVTEIILPDNIEIPASEFTKREATLLALIVPQNAVEGFVILNTSQGELTSKTLIGYSEPISIDAFSPSSIKPGNEITINGDYLNLVGEVIFTDRIAVDSSLFISKSRKQIKLIVPFEAQTGIIAISNAAENPIIVYSEEELNIVLPLAEKVEPNPVKTGGEITISGSDLDLVEKIVLGGDLLIKADDFESQSIEAIKLVVPENTKDGEIILIPASEVEVAFDELVMAVPVVSDYSPKILKNLEGITISGEDLDLVVSISFEGGAEGEIVSISETEIFLNTPETALSGMMELHTMAEKIIEAGSVSFIDPVFTSFSPNESKPNNVVLINGENLDLVKEVWFAGDISGNIMDQNESEISVMLPVGAKTGVITLETLNGMKVSSANEITVLSNLPTISGYGEGVGVPGNILTIQGTDLALIKELVFPGDIYATAYGLKTDTEVEVYVPFDIEIGVGKMRMITYEGEEGLLPEIFFGSNEPVKYPELVINDFDEDPSVHSYGWDNWDGIGTLMNDENSVSGNYIQGNAQLGAWDWKWLWGCNHNSELPKPEVDAEGHVLKIDVKIDGWVIEDANRFQFKLASNDSEWVPLGVRNADGTWGTNDVWLTITFDLVNDLKISGNITNSGDWGIIVQPAAEMDLTQFSFDNLRFEPK